jgi:hypothetical protein
MSSLAIAETLAFGVQVVGLRIAARVRDSAVTG